MVLPSGSTVLFYTDGITDSLDAAGSHLDWNASAILFSTCETPRRKPFVTRCSR